MLPAYVQARKAEGEDPDIDVICVDPPRKGCDSKCLETILEIRPDRDACKGSQDFDRWRIQAAEGSSRGPVRTYGARRDRSFADNKHITGG